MKKDFFRNATAAANRCVTSVLKSSHTLMYAAVLRAGAPCVLRSAASFERNLKNLLAIVVICLQITACSLSPVKTPPINIYTLSMPGDRSAISSRHDQVLFISVPTAAPGYQGVNIVYTLHPYEFRSFTRNRWVASPAEMLAPLLLENLQASGCFSAVVTSPFVGNADLILDTRLLNLRQEFLEKTNQIRMVVQLTLSNNRTHSVMTTQRIEAVVPVAENNPYAGVVAANVATGRVLEKVRRIVCTASRD